MTVYTTSPDNLANGLSPPVPVGMYVYVGHILLRVTAVPNDKHAAASYFSVVSGPL